MPELTRVHIALLKGKIIENLFKRVRGEARVSSGGEAGSVRPSLKTFVVFYDCSLCLAKCVERARVRGMTLSSVVLRCYLWCLRVASSQTISLELLVLLLLLLVVSRSQMLAVRGIPLCLTASAWSARCPRISAPSGSSLGLVKRLTFYSSGLRTLGCVSGWTKTEVTVTLGSVPQPGLVTLTLQAHKGAPSPAHKGLEEVWYG